MEKSIHNWWDAPLPTIEPTKTPPNEEGEYYWFKYKDSCPRIGCLGRDGLFVLPSGSPKTPESLGGYWAKVK